MNDFENDYEVFLADLRIFAEGLRDVGLKEDADALQEIINAAPDCDAELSDD